MKSKGLQPRLLYPARLSIKMEGKIRTFPEKRKQKDYTSTKLALQDMKKGLFYEEEEKQRERNTGTKGGK